MLTKKQVIIKFPGVAKLGIALGSGPRDRGFKSRRSDHVGAKSALLRRFFHSLFPLAPPLQIEFAALVFDLVLGTNLKNLDFHPLFRRCLKNGTIHSGEGFFCQTSTIFRRNTGCISRKTGAVWRKKTRLLGVLTCFKQALIKIPSDGCMQTYNFVVISFYR